MNLVERMNHKKIISIEELRKDTIGIECENIKEYDKLMQQFKRKKIEWYNNNGEADNETIKEEIIKKNEEIIYYLIYDYNKKTVNLTQGYKKNHKAWKIYKFKEIRLI